MRILLPSAAACAAAVLVTTIGLSGSTVAVASPVTPDVSESPLTELDEDGLDAPGARASSTSTANVTNRSTSNLPGLLRAPEAAQTLAAAPGAFAAPGSAFTASPMGLTESSGASVESPAAEAPAEAPAETQAPAPEEEPAETPAAEGPGLGGEEASEAPEDEPAEGPAGVGSVKDQTEDGVTIAAISKVLDVPSKNPSVVGVSFEGESDVTFEVRQKAGDSWGAWEDVDLESSGEGLAGSEPFVVIGAESVQIRALGEGGTPSSTQLVLVDPKRSSYDAEAVRKNTPALPPAGGGEDAQQQDASLPAAADGTEATNVSYTPGTAAVGNTSVKKVSKPKIASRKEWGANESLKNGSPSIAPSVKAAVVHHTAGANGYSAEDVPSILRGIYSFHTKGQGWSDVGYNVLADKYGRLWEGRAGGLDKAVVGAHAARYNTGTFGISVMGSYESKAPPQKTIDAVNHAIAWKLSLDGVSADSTTTVNGKRIKTVVGHRDVGQTACPGQAFYSEMGDMRKAISKMQDGGATPEDEKKKEESKTPIEKKYEGHVKQLGKPKGKEFSIAGGRAQEYEKGHIYWTKETGAQVTLGAIDKAVDEKLLKQIGFPKAGEKGGLPNGGYYQSFAKGSIHWTSETGAQPTWGVLQGYWADKGYERGHLGYPTGAPTVKDGRAEQTFQGARLVWAEGYGTTEFSPRGEIQAGLFDDNAGQGGESGGSGEDSSGPTPVPAPTAEPAPTEEPAPSEEPSASPEPTESPEPTASPSASPEPTEEPKPSEKPEDDGKKDKEKSEAAKRDAVIAEAKKHMGVRYRWGGTSPTSGWDCSGYVQYVYGKNGIKLPRTTSAQRNAGKVISQKDAKPGDLIWVPGHIGIVSETKGQMYDAGSSRTNTSKRSYDWMVKRGAVFIRVI
ncbi:NlpC/P60 family protein [Brevibacterium album]|uniref:NlpC/P60 family protein n=1 Tax=Brevibacterium album TaxID=417948 RepID=UPI000A0331C2|nr:NlpC/P60 family protein [Brevibacterium album]